MKNQFDITSNRKSILNGLLAIMIISFIALGCVCNDLEDENSNESAEKPQKPTNAEIIESETASADEIPSSDVLRAMVAIVLIDLEQTVKKDDYFIIYETLSKDWKKLTKPEKLKSDFKRFGMDKIDYSKLIDQSFIFSQSAKIEAGELGEDNLVLKGYYDVADELYTFNFGYKFEDEQWKLVGIEVNDMN